MGDSLVVEVVPFLFLTNIWLLQNTSWVIWTASDNWSWGWSWSSIVGFWDCCRFQAQNSMVAKCLCVSIYSQALGRIGSCLWLNCMLLLFLLHVFILTGDVTEEV